MKRDTYILIVGFALLVLASVFSTSAGNYVGAGECKQCHGDIYAAWEKNSHSSVFAILEAGNAQENTNCLPCHTTGYTESDDGEYSYAEMNVTCENCHGPGKAHVSSQSKSAIDRGDRTETCIGCHESYWSPAFDYDEYMERGVH